MKWNVRITIGLSAIMLGAALFLTDALPLPGHDDKFEIARMAASRSNLKNIVDALKKYESTMKSSPESIDHLFRQSYVDADRVICPTSRALGMQDANYILETSRPDGLVVTEPDFSAAIHQLSLRKIVRRRLGINREGQISEITD